MLIILSVFFASCEKKENNDWKNDFAKEYEWYSGGLLLGLVNDQQPTESGLIYLDKITDTLNVQFANLTEDNTEYILKIFYDYEEVFYFVNSGSGLINSYTFTADSRESLVIPITLDENLVFNNSHLLTVAVLTAPNKHAVDLDIMTNSYGMSMTFELTQKSEVRQINDTPTAQEPTEFLQANYQGMMLNVDFELNENTSVYFPPKEIRAKSGDTINIAYRVGNYEDTGDVLFIVLVDWQQQRFNANKPYIHIVNNYGYVGYGIIEITAPLEKGKYEITGFAVNNPFELRNAENFHTNDTCHRFTLIVE